MMQMQILLANRILLANVPSGAMSHKPLSDYMQKHLIILDALKQENFLWVPKVSHL